MTRRGHEDHLDSAVTAARDRLAEIDKVTARLSTLEVTAIAPGEEVSVSVDASGRVKQITIDPAGAPERLDFESAERLGRLVARTSRSARAKAADLTRDRSAHPDR